MPTNTMLFGKNCFDSKFIKFIPNNKLQEPNNKNNNQNKSIDYNFAQTQIKRKDDLEINYFPYLSLDLQEEYINNNKKDNKGNKIKFDISYITYNYLINLDKQKIIENPYIMNDYLL